MTEWQDIASAPQTSTSDGGYELAVTHIAIDIRTAAKEPTYE